MFLTWACCVNGMDLASTPQTRTVRNAATRRLRRRSIGRLCVRLFRRYGISIEIETYRGHPKMSAESHFSKPTDAVSWKSIHVRHGAGARTARIATTSAASHRWGCARRTLGGHGKNRKLLGQFLTPTFGAFGFIAAVNQRLKLMVAFPADVFKDRHGQLLTVYDPLSI